MRIELPKKAKPQSVSFNLPGSEQQLQIPVRAVRRTGDAGQGEGNQTALEFNFRTDREREFVTEFIRAAFVRHGEHAGAFDARKLPRVDCSITPVECRRGDLRVRSIDNISTEGLQLRFAGTLRVDETLDLRFRLPGDQRSIVVGAQVVHVHSERFAEYSTAGLNISRVNEIDAARLRNFVVAQSSGAALRAIFERIVYRAEYEADYSVATEDAAALLRSACVLGRCLQLMLEGDQRVVHTELLSARPALMIPRDAFSERDPLDQGVRLYGGLSVDGGSFFFKTVVSAVREDTVELVMPEQLYRSEKRGAHRDRPAGSGTRVSVELDRLPGRQFIGRLLDSSTRGLRCVFHVAEGVHEFLEIGAGLRFDTGAGRRRGELRHATIQAGPEGKQAIIGIESGVERGNPMIRSVSEREWQLLKQAGASAPLGDAAVARLVTYYDRQGRPIKALINATGFGRSAPVVILPPAFGKKKEALAPLAAVLTATFARYGRDLVTIRYDGIDRPGESYSSVNEEERGCDMLRFSISQGLRDLQTTIEFAGSTDLFQALGVVPVTFSMSALEGRKVALDPRNAERIVGWVSVMGVAAGQPALVNTLGGVDPVGNFKLGVPMGICGLLGHLVNLDVIAEDLVEHGYATVSDARADMADVRVPVLWIYGEHDKWVTADDVVDIMSIAAPAQREVICIPAGHNLRTSDDAIATFSLIATRIFAGLHRETVEAVHPNREELLELVTRERERLEQKHVLDPGTYWERYLIGAGDSGGGYDVYRNIGPFRRFLDREVELAAVTAGARVADIGCGTGLFLERLLTDLVQRSPNPPVAVTALDLVPAALESAREKADAVLEDCSCLPCSLHFEVGDFEPSRFVPFIRMRDNATVDPEYLRGKVEGLTNVHLDCLLACARPELEAAVRGEPLDEMLRSKVLDRCGADAGAVIADLNLAARVVRGRVNPEDFLGAQQSESNAGTPAQHFREPELSSLRAENLRFHSLRFGRGPVFAEPLFPHGVFDVVVASLFISYLFNPQYAVEELWRLLAPGGRIVISSMRPDSDISTIFTEYIAELTARYSERNGGTEDDLAHAREMLNEAAGLFELEEEGYFRFYTAEELAALLQNAGFVIEHSEAAMGEPPQAVVVVGVKP